MATVGDYIPFYTKKMRNDIHLYETSYWVSPIPSNKGLYDSIE